MVEDGKENCIFLRFRPPLPLSETSVAWKLLLHLAMTSGKPLQQRIGLHYPLEGHNLKETEATWKMASKTHSHWLTHYLERSLINGRTTCAAMARTNLLLCFSGRLPFLTNPPLQGSIFISKATTRQDSPCNAALANPLPNATSL